MYPSGPKPLMTPIATSEKKEFFLKASRAKTFER
jgi:hypothetical protein